MFFSSNNTFFIFHVLNFKTLLGRIKIKTSNLKPDYGNSRNNKNNLRFIGLL